MSQADAKNTPHSQASDAMNNSEQIIHILEGVAEAIFALDHQWRFTYINAQAEQSLLRTRDDLLGKCIWDEFPEAVGSTFEREYRHALQKQTQVTFEEYFAPLGKWFEVRAYPTPYRLLVFFQNVNERRKSAQALRESEERYRLFVEGARDYAMMLFDEKGCITGWNTGAERILGWSEAEALGESTRLIFTEEDCARGIPEREMNRAITEGRAIDLRWHRKKDNTLFYADGILEALINDQGHLRGYVKILRDISERKALEDERERLAHTNRLLLDSTGGGIYGVGLDGCFTFVNRAAAALLGFIPEQVIGRNAHDLIHHSYPDGTAYPEDQCPIYQAVLSGERVHVENDVFWNVEGISFPVSYTAAPIVEQGVVRGIVITFDDISERKALEQERERLAERERNIARQLQAALTPAIPDHMAGMALTKYYEAALDEAGVGGDFYDVFSLDEQQSALVVGDLSGKGLSAAAQVATVRNMLRYTLYSQPLLSEAITSLNQVLVDHALLSGFATLFVGCFDASTGELSYVNCGQEPALLKRAVSGQIEILSPTGPILGGISGAIFRVSTIRLLPGDVLAIFTDGLTECGPNRLEMLGIDGVSLLLERVQPSSAESDAALVAESVALQMIAGVDAAARGGVMRDDVCLLVGVVERPSPTLPG